MKKLFLALVLVSAALIAEAQIQSMANIGDQNGIFKVSWTPFQLALVPEKYCHLFSGSADVWGIAIGIFVLEQKSAAVSVSVTCGQHINYGILATAVSVNDLNYGLNVSALTSFIRRNYGLQIGVVNVESDGNPRPKELQPGAPGLQIGAFNIGQGFQIGVLNYNPSASIQVLPIFNFSK